MSMSPENVKDIRKKASLTQYEFSVILSYDDGTVSERTIQDWEAGRRKPSGPALSLLGIVRDVLGGRLATSQDLLEKIGSPQLDTAACGKK